MSVLPQNLRHAFCRLGRSPGFTAVAVLSLALGIGANVGIFSLFERILLRPLPVQEPGRLVNLVAPGPKPGSQSTRLAGGVDAVFSYPMFRDLERAQEPFTGFAAHCSLRVSLASGDEVTTGVGVLVSGAYFPVLGVRPALGRLLGAADDRAPGGHPVAVLSHRFWMARFGADPRVLDRTIAVNGYPLTIVGVAPPGFDGVTPGQRPDVFVPITMRGALQPGTETGFEDRRRYWVYLFARLKPGVSIERASDALNRVYQPILDEVEAPLQEGMSAATMARFRAKEVILEDGRRGQSLFDENARTPLVFLFGITGIVLLITCANIANLLLARGAGRSQELAIRGSLGARRSQLLAQLFTEACLLTLLGAVASLLVARGTLAFLGALLSPEVAAVVDLTLSRSALVFTAVLALGTGLLFGVYPAVHATRLDVVTALKSAAAQHSQTRSAARFRTSLVTAQIALSMALLISAGLFARSLANVRRVDLGLRAENRVTFDIAPGLNGYEPEASRVLFRRVEEELAALPGVTAVSAATVAVLRGSAWANDVSVEGFDPAPDGDSNARTNAIAPGYFRTLGIPLLSGRGFTIADRAGAPRVAIVNQTFAREFGLDEREVVGARMAIGSSADELDVEIVGLVRDAKYSRVKADVPPLYVMPWRQDDPPGRLTFYARTAIAPDSLLAAIPAMIQRLDPHLPVENLKTLRQQVRESVSLDRLISTFSAAFAVLATLLAAVGLCGTMAYTVAQRTREIGLRVALGATPHRIRRMVLGQVARMTLVGGAIGIAGALAVGRAARSFLFEVTGHDPWVVTGGAALLGLVALGAGYLPAWRAARVDPMIALRAE